MAALRTPARGLPGRQDGSGPSNIESSDVQLRVDLDGTSYGFLLLGGFVVAALLRVMLVMASPFPLRDGGMFYVMLKNLDASHLALPRYTTYNAAHIPFAYPPLAFYAMELVHLVTRAPFLSILRFYALGFNLLAMVAFYLLARSLLSSRTAVVVAVFSFGLLPRAFYIAGGDAPRAMGLCFALLTLWQIVEMYKTPRMRAVLLAAVFSAASAASHLEWAWFLGYSVPLLFLFSRRSRADILRTLSVVAGTVCLTAPWWVIVVLRAHGFTPFISALTGSSSVFPWYGGLSELLQLHLTDEVWFPVISALALGGVAYLVARRQWLLPSWLLAIFLLESRASVLRRAILVALLAGVGVDALLIPLVQNRDALGRLSKAARPLPRWGALLLAFLLVRGMVTSWGAEAASVLGTPLPARQRAMMTWVRSHTAPASTFLLLTGVGWSVDDAEEWFPALANRTSLDTVQGYEWLPGQFAHRFALDESAQGCASLGSGCLSGWMHQWHERPTYVALIKGQVAGFPGSCCDILRASLLHDGRFAMVYDGPGATIFRLK